MEGIRGSEGTRRQSERERQREREEKRQETERRGEETRERGGSKEGGGLVRLLTLRNTAKAQTVFSACIKKRDIGITWTKRENREHFLLKDQRKAGEARLFR